MDYMSILTFFYSQLFITPKYPDQSCKGQVHIVTGANTGLGFEAARHLVRLGADKVILACRNLEKGEAAVKDIEASTKRIGVAEVWSLDLSSFESVKEFAKKVDTLPRIDAIVENAGMSYTILDDYMQIDIHNRHQHPGVQSIRRQRVYNHGERGLDLPLSPSCFACTEAIIAKAQHPTQTYHRRLRSSSLD